MSIKKSPLAMVVGTTLFSGLAVTAVQAEEFVGAESNPFTLTELADSIIPNGISENQAAAIKATTTDQTIPFNAPTANSYLR
jgi:hypothetical protein